MHILALDPGTRNFGVAVLHVSGTGARVESWHLTNTMWDLKQGGSQGHAFANEIEQITRKHAISLVICERFQPRGRCHRIIENVNIMIGIVMQLVTPVPVMLVTAATWKNRVNKWLPLNDSYGRVCSPHQLDAICMSLYCWGVHSGDFSMFSPRNRARIINNLG